MWLRLKALSAAVTAAMPRAKDRETRMHLDDMKDQIAKALDPKVPLASPASGGGSRGLDLQGPSQDPQTCWPDYEIKR
jgi:hypothetical protein